MTATTDSLIQIIKDKIETENDEPTIEGLSRSLVNLIEAKRLEQFVENKKEA